MDTTNTARTYTITNQKGGAGKTTTAAALASGLALKGYNPLLIDLDPQCNLSFCTGARTTGASILGVLTGEISAAAAIQHTGAGDIIPASKHLSGADLLFTDTGKEYRLREALEPLRGQYSHFIIDTPPALGVLTVNALTASGAVIIPAQADIFSLQGIERLSETLQPVKRYTNPGLKIEGILLTRYAARSVLSREIFQLAQQIAAKLQTRVFRATIRESVTIREAQISQQTLFQYAPRAKVTADYAAFIDELLTEGR